MTHFTELALIFIILAAVGIPLFANVSSNPLFTERDPKLELYKHLLVRKEEILISIKELDFDYTTGKLSQDDYESSKKKLETEALETLEEIDRMEHNHNKSGSDKNSKNLEMA